MHIGKTLISERRIRRRVRELGAQITSSYLNQDLTLIGVLNGSVCFMADLMREISLPVEVIFIRLSSYEGTWPGEISAGTDFNFDVAGRHVLIVEDIVDTGSTVKFIEQKLSDLGATTVEICTLLDKPSLRVHQTRIRYIGFQILDEFVVGYGLDYDGLYRNLRHVAILEE